MDPLAGAVNNYSGENKVSPNFIYHILVGDDIGGGQTTKGGAIFNVCSKYEAIIRVRCSFWSPDQKMESKNGRLYFH